MSSVSRPPGPKAPDDDLPTLQSASEPGMVHLATVGNRWLEIDARAVVDLERWR